MATHTLKKLPKSTVEIFITLPKEEVQKEYESAFRHLQRNLEVEGFRKGKVPRSLAEKHITKESVYEELIRSIIPKLYEEVLQKENLHPVIQPRVELVKAKEGDDWQIKILVAEKPVVELKNYKAVIKAKKKEHTKPDIWVPSNSGQKGGNIGDKAHEQTQAQGEQSQIKNQQLLNEIFTSLLKEVKVEISELIIEEELNHRLSRLLDEMHKIGLTVESYLKSKNTSMDQLKALMSKEVEETYRLEFILTEIAEKENIIVEEADLDKVFKTIKTEEERKNAQHQAYLYARILRKQKALDFLLGL